MQILYEDNHLIAVNKPFGMPSQGDITGDESVFDWVKSYIAKTYNKPGNVYLALIHRLDRPAGGVILLAKTSKAAGRVSKQFQEKQTQKSYLAITEQIPQPVANTLEHYVKKLPGKNIVRAYQKEIHASKFARLHYQVLGNVGRRALVSVKLETGRRHQIRVQLASINCTIQGDVKYGKSDFNPDKSICLLAHQLTLTHPTLKTPLTITAYPPANALWAPFREFIPNQKEG